jgi:hypothetical protein
VSAQRTGAYVTRGRANELDRKIELLRTELLQRIDGLEAELARLREFPLDVARRQIGATLEAVRASLQAGGPGTMT